MKIAIDSWVLASRFQCHGTYVYASSLISEFQKIARSRRELKFCLFTASQKSNDAGLVEPSESFELVPTALLRHERLWRLGGITRAATRAGADLIFAPTLSAFPVGSIPTVCTIHDVTPVVMPSHSTAVTTLQRSLLWFATRQAKAIITVSECSRKDLIRTYGIPEMRVCVIYNGYDKATFNDAAPDPAVQAKLLARLGLNRPYILHHGTIQPRKNLKRLIQAFRLMLDRNPNLKFDLLLVGRLGWAYDEVVEAAHLPSSSGRVVLTGPLDSPDLAMLIKEASLVVVPSLYEGFCLPMVEAMACGAPVIAANSSCLPEVSGGVLKYFDPLSVEDMASCMEQALQDKELSGRLVREGKTRAAFFDWRRCAEQTVAVLQEAVAASQEDGILDVGT